MDKYVSVPVRAHEYISVILCAGLCAWVWRLLFSVYLHVASDLVHAFMYT